MDKQALTPDELKTKHSEEIAKSETFKTLGVNGKKAVDYLDTPEGILYEQRLVEADPSTPLSEIRKRAIGQLNSGRELPRMEIIDEPLAKIVPQGTKMTAYSPYMTKLSHIENALAAGQNLSDYFALPIASEAPRYDIYGIYPRKPTEVFVNTVAPTSELGGQVTKLGGAEQYVVPNRQLYSDPVLIKQIDNQLPLHLRPAMGALGEAAIASETAVVRASSGSIALKGGGILLAGATTAYDVADTYQKVSQLRTDGNEVGAHSELVHFGTRNLGALGGAALGATAGAAAGIESGPGLFLTGAIGGIAGAVASDKLAAYLDNRKIYNQEDHQGNTWHFDPEKPKLGWRREDEVAMVNNKTGVLQKS